MDAALTPCCAGPEWQTAVATWFLFGVTIAAVIVGGVAALWAARSYALEAEPVIVARELIGLTTDETQRRISASPHYVVAGSPTLSDGVVLRPYGNTDDPNFGKGGVLTYQPPRPTLVFAIQNVGRSPAVGIKIGWDLRLSVFVKSADTTYDRVVEQRGSRYISITAAIASQDTTYVRIENLLGVGVNLSVKPMGTQIDWRSVQRRTKKIAVIAAEPSFRLNGPTETAPT